TVIAATPPAVCRRPQKNRPATADRAQLTQPSQRRGSAVMPLSESSTTAPSTSPGHTLGLFEGETDVGTVKLPGSTTYDGDQQTYPIAGGGAYSWAEHDAFHFV